MLKLYKKGDGSTNYASVNDSLQKFKTATGDKPKFYLADPETTFDNAFRYVDNLDDLIDVEGKIVLEAHTGDGWYFSFDGYSNSADAISKLQLPPGKIAKYRIKASTSSVKNRIVVPYGRGNTTELLESICKDYPEWLSPGGGTQILIENTDVEILEILDISGTVP